MYIYLHYIYIHVSQNITNITVISVCVKMGPTPTEWPSNTREHDDSLTKGFWGILFLTRPHDPHET